MPNKTGLTPDEAATGAVLKPPTAPSVIRVVQPANITLPLHVDSRYGFVVDSDGDDIALCAGLNNAHNVARFIVTACNSHYELVDALKQIRRDVGAMGHLSGESLVQMEAAIAKAETKPGGDDE